MHKYWDHIFMQNWYSGKGPNLIFEEEISKENIDAIRGWHSKYSIDNPFVNFSKHSLQTIILLLVCFPFFKHSGWIMSPPLVCKNKDPAHLVHTVSPLFSQVPGKALSTQ